MSQNTSHGIFKSLAKGKGLAIALAFTIAFLSCLMFVFFGYSRQLINKSSVLNLYPTRTTVSSYTYILLYTTLWKWILTCIVELLNSLPPWIRNASLNWTFCPNCVIAHRKKHFLLGQRVFYPFYVTSKALVPFFRFFEGKSSD